VETRKGRRTTGEGRWNDRGGHLAVKRMLKERIPGSGGCGARAVELSGYEVGGVARERRLGLGGSTVLDF
jgi:hypothetical protein